jgi:hypothetical protein
MYQAIVTPIQSILPHPNADKLEIAVVCNTHVCVGIGQYKKDDLVIFFETDGCLFPAYCEPNGLYEEFVEVDGVKTKVGNGYLKRTGHVRPLNLRSYKSNGLVMPLSSLDFIDFDRSVLQAGYSFTALGGVEICRKYETPATREARRAGQPNQPRLEVKIQFPEHVETENFRRNVQKIPVGATITITEKIHSTSGRAALAYTEQEIYNPFLSTVFNRLNVSTPYPVVNKAWNWLRQTIEEKTKQTIKGYQPQNGTRRVVLKKDSGNTGYYGSDDFRWAVADRLLPMLRKGETLYYEIVGWVAPDRHIMPPHNTAVTGDKKFIKQYGQEITYNYGVPNGTAKAYVYRIAVTNEDGYQWELPWEAVKARCAELGVDHVPEHTVIYDYDPDESYLWKSDNSKFISIVENLSLQSTFPNQFPEGVVVRVDHAGKTWYLKEKNWYFLAMEGFMKDKPDYVDTEEVES